MVLLLETKYYNPKGTRWHNIVQCCVEGLWRYPRSVFVMATAAGEAPVGILVSRFRDIVAMSRALG